MTRTRIAGDQGKAVGVIGGGAIGAGIAEVIARSGDHVRLVERDQEAADSAV